MTPFGKVIRAILTRRQLTLEQFGRKVGTHKGYVSGWINGKVNPPSPKILRKIVAKIAPEISVEDLLELAWAQKAPAEVRERIFERLAGKSALENPLLATYVRPAEVVIPGTREAV